MRMAELSGRVRVPVATIKYYLREGLLPPGERTSRTRPLRPRARAQAEAGCVRCWTSAGCPIARVREVLDGSTSATTSTRCSAPPSAPAAAPHQRRRADQGVGHGAAHRGRGTARLELRADNPVVDSAVGTIGAFAALGRTELVDRLAGYASWPTRWPRSTSPASGACPSGETVVEAAVVGHRARRRPVSPRCAGSPRSTPRPPLAR